MRPRHIAAPVATDISARLADRHLVHPGGHRHGRPAWVQRQARSCGRRPSVQEMYSAAAALSTQRCPCADRRQLIAVQTLLHRVNTSSDEAEDSCSTSSLFNLTSIVILAPGLAPKHKCALAGRGGTGRARRHLDARPWGRALSPRQLLTSRRMYCGHDALRGFASGFRREMRYLEHWEQSALIHVRSPVQYLSRVRVHVAEKPPRVPIRDRRGKVCDSLQLPSAIRPLL